MGFEYARVYPWGWFRWYYVWWDTTGVHLGLEMAILEYAADHGWELVSIRRRALGRDEFYFKRPKPS